MREKDWRREWNSNLAAVTKSTNWEVRMSDQSPKTTRQQTTPPFIGRLGTLLPAFTLILVTLGMSEMLNLSSAVA